MKRFRSLVKHLGMSGADGDLSFSKTFGYAVLTCYCFGSGLPTTVAITLIISAHGTKLMLEAIRNGVFGVKSISTDIRQTVDIHKVEERVGWDTDREYQAS